MSNFSGAVHMGFFVGCRYSSRMASNPKNPATDMVRALDSVIKSTTSEDIAENTNISNGNSDIPFAKSNPVFLDFSGYFLFAGNELIHILL